MLAVPLLRLTLLPIALWLLTLRPVALWLLTLLPIALWLLTLLPIALWLLTLLAIALLRLTLLAIPLLIRLLRVALRRLASRRPRRLIRRLHRLQRRRRAAWVSRHAHSRVCLGAISRDGDAKSALATTAARSFGDRLSATKLEGPPISPRRSMRRTLGRGRCQNRWSPFRSSFASRRLGESWGSVDEPDGERGAARRADRHAVAKAQPARLPLPQRLHRPLPRVVPPRRHQIPPRAPSRRRPFSRPIPSRQRKRSATSNSPFIFP